MFRKLVQTQKKRKLSWKVSSFVLGWIMGLEPNTEINILLEPQWIRDSAWNIRGTLLIHEVGELFAPVGNLVLADVGIDPTHCVQV